MKLTIIPKTFYKKTADLLEACDVICTTFYEKGYTLTLRQLFYQLVSTNKIANTVKEYKNLGVVVSDGRYAGVLDWEHITDRIRVIHDAARWKDAKHRLQEAGKTLRIDTLRNQKYRPEVWIEKDALIELAENVCTPWDIPYVAVKAYSSTSALWEARKRFLNYLNDGQEPLILHLGDLDCTGDDCSRHLKERMSLMTGHDIELTRLGLNPDQVEHYELPPQPGKTADPRFKGYVQKHGTENVWELDALTPEVIEALIENGISEVIDTDIRGTFLDKQAAYAADIAAMAENYDAIATEGFEPWAALTSMSLNSNGFKELPDTSSKSAIHHFHGSISKSAIHHFAEMDADTAEKYRKTLHPDTWTPLTLTSGEMA